MHHSLWAPFRERNRKKKINEFKGVSTSGHKTLLLEWPCCYKQLKNYIHFNRFQTLEKSQNRTVILERKKTNKSDLCLIYVTFWSQFSELWYREREAKQSWVISISWRARVRWKEVEKDQRVGKYTGEKTAQRQRFREP